jgi:hypothetical protein
MAGRGATAVRTEIKDSSGVVLCARDVPVQGFAWLSTMAFPPERATPPLTISASVVGPAATENPAVSTVQLDPVSPVVVVEAPLCDQAVRGDALEVRGRAGKFDGRLVAELRSSGMLVRTQNVVFEAGPSPTTQWDTTIPVGDAAPGVYELVVYTEDSGATKSNVFSIPVRLAR